MFAVIFEVEPRPDRWEGYLTLAAALRPELERIDGFIANQRYLSRRREGRVLSLSIWRDEKAVVRWRTAARHHQAQALGRSEIFADYHLRVGEIAADNRPPPGASLTQQRLDETETGAAKAVTLSELTDADAAPDLAVGLGLPSVGAAGLIAAEIFAGIGDAKKLLLLASWRNTAAAAAWQPAGAHEGLRHRLVRIIRDYGLNDRREAPQYHPPVGPARDPG
jgi:heme-degrading monooxygenase HmoA